MLGSVADNGFRDMRTGGSYKLSCDFCASPLAEVDLLFRSEVGGLPPAICSDCVVGFADVVKLHRVDPDAAARAIAAHNASIENPQS